jgi:hypothetical protein
MRDQATCSITPQAMYVSIEACWRNHCCCEKSSEYYILCVCVCNLSYRAYNVHVTHCHLWFVLLYHIFQHYLTNGKIFGKRLLNIKRVFWFSLQLLSETFFIQRRIERDIIINVHRSMLKVAAVIVSLYNETGIVDRLLLCLLSIL